VKDPCTIALELDKQLMAIHNMEDNIVDRDQLQNDYIERIIDGMDHKTMYQYIYDMLEQNFEKYTVDEIIGEVEEYYPDLLDS
jgi:hypothetical protein